MPAENRCNRCGECCLQGGPALHTQDLELIRKGHIARHDLVTVRRGELALQPLQTSPQSVEQEFLKLRGNQGEWSCLHFDPDQSGCMIYEHRPLACRVLECTAPEPLLALAGKDLLSRFDLIAGSEAILPYIREHENRCACPSLQEIAELLENPVQGIAVLNELEELVNLDIRYRTVLQNRFQLSVGLELFYLGRPIFQLLSPLGVAARQDGERIRLAYNGTV